MLNGVLCPCGPLPAANGPEPSMASGSMDHMDHARMGHADADGEMPADSSAADCHTELAVDDCSMADAGDPDATGKHADRSFETAKSAPSYASVAIHYPGAPPSVRNAPGWQAPPSATPISNRDRLLI